MNCVTIGDNVAIHANTVIKEGTIIGNDVIIDSNNPSVIIVLNICRMNVIHMSELIASVE